MPDILRRAKLVNREVFDPLNASHLESLKIFLRTGSWGAVQFWPEDPYTEAPVYVMTAFARHTLGVVAETPGERTERLALRGVLTTTDVTESHASKLLRIDRANEMVRAHLTSRPPAHAN